MEGPEAQQQQPHRLKFVVSFVLCVGAFVGLAALLAWHLYLLSAGQVRILWFWLMQPVILRAASVGVVCDPSYSISSSQENL